MTTCSWPSFNQFSRSISQQGTHKFFVIFSQHCFLLQAKMAEKGEDIAIKFNDSSLNTRVEDLSTGKIFALYEYSLHEGAYSFECKACGVTTYGKRNLDSHVTGKKHLANMSNFRVLSKFACCSDLETQIISLCLFFLSQALLKPGHLDVVLFCHQKQRSKSFLMTSRKLP